MGPTAQEPFTCCFLSENASKNTGPYIYYIVVYKPVARQRPRNRQLPLLGSGQHATMEVLLEAAFSICSAPRLYHETDRVQRVVGGDEKGSLKFETVNYDHESQGTRTGERLRSRGAAAYDFDFEAEQ
jgi:hypothetical protein